MINIQLFVAYLVLSAIVAIALLALLVGLCSSFIIRAFVCLVWGDRYE